MANDVGGVDSSTFEDWFASRRAESVADDIRGSEAIVSVDILHICSRDKGKMREEKGRSCGREI